MHAWLAFSIRDAGHPATIFLREATLNAESFRKWREERLSGPRWLEQSIESILRSLYIITELLVHIASFFAFLVWLPRRLIYRRY